MSIRFRWLNSGAASAMVTNGLNVYLASTCGQVGVAQAALQGVRPWRTNCLNYLLAQGEYRVPGGPFSNHGTLGSGGWNTLS